MYFIIFDFRAHQEAQAAKAPTENQAEAIPPVHPAALVLRVLLVALDQKETLERTENPAEKAPQAPRVQEVLLVPQERPLASAHLANLDPLEVQALRVPLVPLENLAPQVVLDHKEAKEARDQTPNIALAHEGPRRNVLGRRSSICSSEHNFWHRDAQLHPEIIQHFYSRRFIKLVAIYLITVSVNFIIDKQIH